MPSLNNVSSFSFHPRISLSSFDALVEELKKKQIIENLAPTQKSMGCLSPQEIEANKTFQVLGVPEIRENDILKLGFLILKRKDSIEQFVLGRDCVVYLCNDSGKTIESLRAKNVIRNK